MNVACIIARTNSTRLKQKVLRKVGNVTAIEFLIQRIKLSKFVDKIYLCTSIDPADRILLDIAEKNEIYSFAGDKQSVISRMLAVGEKEAATNLIRITGDNFLTDFVYLDIMLDSHNKLNSEYTRTEFLPIGITSEIMKLEMLERCYREMDPNFSEYLLLYAFDPDKHNCSIIIPPKKHQNPNEFLTVDTPEDLNKFYLIYKIFQNYNFNYDELVNNYLKSHKKKIKEDKRIKFPAGLNMFYSSYRNEMNKRIELSNQINISVSEYLKYAKQQ